VEHRSTELASGEVNGAEFKIELIEAPGVPPQVLTRWPQPLTVTTPTSFNQMASSAMRILSNAVVTLAAIRVERKL
jgi:hypothetical protein